MGVVYESAHEIVVLKRLPAMNMLTYLAGLGVAIFDCVFFCFHSLTYASSDGSVECAGSAMR